MQLLKNVKEIDKLLEAAIARLCEEDGDNWEIFCMNRNDERYMLQFFAELKAMN